MIYATASLKARPCSCREGHRLSATLPPAVRYPSLKLGASRRISSLAIVNVRIKRITIAVRTIDNTGYGTSEFLKTIMNNSELSRIVERGFTSAGRPLASSRNEIQNPTCSIWGRLTIWNWAFFPTCS